MRKFYSANRSFLICILYLWRRNLIFILQKLLTFQTTEVEQSLQMNWFSDLIIFVNGTRQAITNPDPRMTLLTFLRTELRITGTKLGCGEGGCGACTVMLSFIKDGEIHHKSCNACLTPLCSLDKCAITTIEGVNHPSLNRDLIFLLRKNIY